jgi:hypothetical protein
MVEVEAQRNAISSEIVQQIEELDEPEICKKQRQKILSKIGPFAYKAWFINVSMELDKESKKFKCHGSRFVVDCVSTRYRDLLELESENPTPAEKVVEVGPLPDFQAIRRENFSKSCHG